MAATGERGDGRALGLAHGPQVVVTEDPSTTDRSASAAAASASSGSLRSLAGGPGPHGVAADDRALAARWPRPLTQGGRDNVDRGPARPPSTRSAKARRVGAERRLPGPGRTAAPAPCVPGHHGHQVRRPRATHQPELVQHRPARRVAVISRRRRRARRAPTRVRRRPARPAPAGRRRRPPPGPAGPAPRPTRTLPARPGGRTGAGAGRVHHHVAEPAREPRRPERPPPPAIRPPPMPVPRVTTGPRRPPRADPAPARPGPRSWRRFRATASAPGSRSAIRPPEGAARPGGRFGRETSTPSEVHLPGAPTRCRLTGARPTDLDEVGPRPGGHRHRPRRRPDVRPSPLVFGSAPGPRPPTRPARLDRPPPAPWSPRCPRPRPGPAGMAPDDGPGARSRRLGPGLEFAQRGLDMDGLWPAS